MKKLLLLSATLFTLLTYAGPKADIEAAKKLFEAKKNKEAVELLKKSVLVKGEEKEFEEINFFLAKNVAQTAEEVVMYLNRIVADKTSKTDIAIASNRELLNRAKTDPERVRLAEELNVRLDGENPIVLGQLAYLYDKVDNKVKYDEIYNKAMKNSNEDFKATFLYAITENMLVTGNANGINFANKILALNKSAVSSEVYLLLSDYYFDKMNNKRKGEEYLLLSEKVAPKSPEILYAIATRYLSINEKVKGYNYLLKVEKLLPNNSEVVARLFVVSVDLSKAKEEVKYGTLLKKLAKINNTNLGTLLYNSDNLKGAEKYYKLGLKEKNAEANLGLAYVEAAKGNKALAIRYAEAAHKAKVQGAETILNELKLMK